ncbi:MAG: hypothetical protein GXY85_12950, partial [Candidatus Brocadiaceae bacterium]|nr:hypothetical protein [Candidatus Brocadiaceae bacterium]
MDGIGTALAVVYTTVGPRQALMSLAPLICVAVVLAGLAVAVILAAVLIVRQESRQRPPASQAGPAGSGTGEPASRSLPHGGAGTGGGGR